MLAQQDDSAARRPMATSTGGTARTLDDVLHQLQQTYPEQRNPWTLHLPKMPGEPVFAQPDGGEKDLRVAVDPSTGEVTETGRGLDALRVWILDLHTEFGAGKSGRQWVAVTGLILIVSLATGLFLALREGFWKRPLAPLDPRSDLAGWAAFWHRWAGAGGAALLLPITMTGILLVLTAVTERAGPGNGDPLHGGSGILRSQADSERGAIGPESAVAMARGMFRSSTVVAITTPRNMNGTYRVQLCRRSETCSHHVSTTAWIDQYSGAVLGSDDHPGERTHVRWLAWHDGSAVGMLGRTLWFAAGLIPAFLFGTGFWLWMRERRR